VSIIDLPVGTVSGKQGDHREVVAGDARRKISHWRTEIR